MLVKTLVQPTPAYKVNYLDKFPDPDVLQNPVSVSILRISLILITEVM